MSITCEKTAADVLIIGYGNLLRSDDGAGRKVVEKLERDGLPGLSCDFLSCQHLLPEHAAEVTGYKLVFFIDASLSEDPGDIVLHEISADNGADDTVEKFHHCTSPQGVLAAATRLYGTHCRAYLCRIGGRDFRVSDRISPDAHKGVDKAVTEIKKTINNIQI